MSTDVRLTASTPRDLAAAGTAAADLLRALGLSLEAEHSCMTLRGAQATGSSTVTSSLRGGLRSDPRSRQEFLALAGVGL